MNRQPTVFLILTVVMAVAVVRASVAAQGPASQSAEMPAAQQDALLRAHCVGCHTSTKPAGGLALDTFDAARPDPGIARMLRVKIAEDGALSAAGLPKPDAATADALVRALGTAADAEADTVGRWRAFVAQEGRNGYSLITARIVGRVERTAGASPSAAYELTLTCGGKTRKAGVTLARRTSEVGRLDQAAGEALTTAVDLVVDEHSLPSAAPESTSADAALMRALSTLPERTLTVRPSTFPGESVTFPFRDLTPPVRQLLSWCFNGGKAS